MVMQHADNHAVPAGQASPAALSATDEERTPSQARVVSILTLGCKLNQAESDAIARELQGLGFFVVDRPVAASAYVINTCSVTSVADKKSRHLVRLSRRLSPDATIVLTGCYPETAGMTQALATGADIVVPSRDKHEVVARLLAARPAGEPLMPPGGGSEAFAPSSAARSARTRAFVKAQEGCNDVCAFCIVPRTRGRERSIAPLDVADVVRQREAAGVQEVVITGTQLGAYGRDFDGFTYGPAGLIGTLLAETSVPRIRFSSLQPQDITPELLELWSDPRLCRHFHLALQSGSEPVLRRMRRRYTLGRYREALAMIRRAVPGAAITTDVIAGFPGETAEEAAESLRFCREAAFAQMHVFPYSRRPGTTANVLGDHVPEPLKRARVAELLTLAAESATAFRRHHIGTVLPVLWEERAADEQLGPVWEGLTDTYVRVFARSGRDLRNRLEPARLVSDAADGIWAEPMPAGSALATQPAGPSGAFEPAGAYPRPFNLPNSEGDVIMLLPHLDRA